MTDREQQVRERAYYLWEAEEWPPAGLGLHLARAA